MADNGRPFPRSKTTLYDSGMKTPMIMHWPSGGFKTNVMVDALVSSVDLAPTILEITGLPLHHRLQGRSMIPICHDPEAEIRKFIFGERNWHVQRGCGRLVRNGDWVYIRDFTPNCFSFQMVNHKDGAYSELLRLRSEGVLSSVEEATFSTDRPRELLFNVRKDIDQLDNLVDHAEYKNILAFMRLELKKWQSTTGDTIPDINQMTPDRHDRHTFKRLFFEGRPGGGVIAGQESNAANISN
jgi:arylsulfatase A-like enzyme